MSFYKEVITILQESGYTFVRQKGSHENWCRNGKNCVTVPSNLKSRHLGNKILKDAKTNRKI